MSGASVFLSCDVGTEKEIVHKMSGISGILQANKLAGIYDIVAELHADSEKGIARLVRRLRSSASIRACLTILVAEKDL